MTFIQTKHPNKSIILQTRRGRNISNTQSGFLTNVDKSMFPDLQKKYPKITLRGMPNPLYNCHGLTFASRRTAIYESEELWKIIKDDDYQEIGNKDVLPGDIVLYFSDDGDIEHSGIVVSEPDPTFKIPQVLSKWGKYSEIIHRANNCPYDKSRIRYFRVT